MKKLLISALLVAFASTTALAVDAPGTVTLQAKNGNVTFDHKAHSSKMECSVCHGAAAPAKITLDKDSAHKLCKDCHTTKGAGPTKCGECHKK